MTKIKPLLLAAALATPGLAAAQTGGVAVADLETAVTNATAFVNANTQIRTTYKAQIDQAQARTTQAQTQIRTLLTTVDTNKDGQVSQAEQAANPAAVQQIQTAQQAAAQEIQRIQEPATRAQAYAVEQIEAQLQTAVQNVVKARSITLMVKPEAVLFAQPAADVTPAITAELNRLVPSVNSTPPAGWQPGANRQGAAAPAAGTPATTSPASSSRRSSGR